MLLQLGVTWLSLEARIHDVLLLIKKEHMHGFMLVFVSFTKLFSIVTHTWNTGKNYLEVMLS